MDTEAEAFIAYHRDIHGIDYSGTDVDPVIVAMYLPDDVTNTVVLELQAAIRRRNHENP